MFETELKFQVPPERWAALRKAVATASAVTTRLQALYVETPGHDLAAAGLALRLRKEGRVWVQTLKGRGDGMLQRLEHEVRLPAQRGLPQIDAQRHAGTPAGQLLQQVLEAARAAGRSDALQVLYRTDIRRLHRRVRHGGAVVEIALDQGLLLADTDAPVDGQPSLRLPVAEIEFELVSGPPPALASLAARWAARFGLWWDVRTKSERGFRLALGRTTVPAVRARPQQLPPVQAPPALALAAMLQACLAQALPNLAELAGGSDPAAPAAATPSPGGAAARAEHLHQVRVALRRLRTALTLFAHWAPEPAAALALEPRWRQVFAALGAARDADVLGAMWMPQLQAAGAPALAPVAAASGIDVAAQLRDPAVTVLLLETLQLVLSLSQPAAPSARVAMPADVQALAHAVVRRAWRRAWADARVFADAPVAQQHRARKRLKQLRYALEFLQPWLPPKPLKRWLRALGRALQALGEHNDLHIAKAHFEARASAEPQAWFAVGWLAAREEATQQRAADALARLKARKPARIGLPG